MICGQLGDFEGCCLFCERFHEAVGDPGSPAMILPFLVFSVKCRFKSKLFVLQSKKFQKKVSAE